MTITTSMVVYGGDGDESHAYLGFGGR